MYCFPENFPKYFRTTIFETPVNASSVSQYKIRLQSEDDFTRRSQNFQNRRTKNLIIQEIKEHLLRMSFSKP